MGGPRGAALFIASAHEYDEYGLIADSPSAKEPTLNDRDFMTGIIPEQRTASIEEQSSTTTRTTVAGPTEGHSRREAADGASMELQDIRALQELTDEQTARRLGMPEKHSSLQSDPEYTLTVPEQLQGIIDDPDEALLPPTGTP
jgi:hypothetical protein